MKNLNFLVILMLTFSSCAVFVPATDSPKLDGVKWKLIAIKGIPTSVDGDKAYLEFDDKDRISGKAACNSFFGEYEILPHNQLSLSGIGSTKMYCEGVMDIENQMIMGMRDVKKYEVKADMLYLSNSDGLLLTFKR